MSLINFELFCIKKFIVKLSCLLKRGVYNCYYIKFFVLMVIGEIGDCIKLLLVVLIVL